VSSRSDKIAWWLLLVWCFAAAVHAWTGHKAQSVSAISIILAYAAILIYGLFFQSREEFREAGLKYVSLAMILVLWWVLLYAVFAK